MNIRTSTKKASNRIITKVNKQYGIKNYDDDNCYPQRVMLLTNSSPTAKACLNTYGRFIEGGGFKDTVFYKAVMNSDGQTNDKILRLVRTDLARNRGIAIHLNVNALGKIVEVYHTPFEHVRITTSEKREETGCEYAVYNDWNCQINNSIKKDDITYLPKVNLDPEAILDQVIQAGGWDNYKGQLMYVSLDEGTYPLASCDAVIESMFAEIQSDVTTTNNVEQNFSAKGIFVHKGKFESDEKKEEFADDFEEFLGPQGAPVIVLDVDKEEDIPEFIEIPQTKTDDQFEYTDSKIMNKIVRNYLIPKILLSITDDGGGFFNQEQIRDATMYYNSVTLMERTLLEETFSFIGKNFSYKINATDDYTILPIQFQVSKDNPTAINNLIKDTTILPSVKRAMLVSIFGVSADIAKELAPDLVAPAQDKRLLVDILGVGGTQAMQMILADVGLTAEQKKAALKIIFGLNDADAEALAGIITITP